MQRVLKEALFLESIKNINSLFLPSLLLYIPPPLYLFSSTPLPPTFLLPHCRNVTLQSWNVVRWVKVTINFNFST